ncbi:MAG TPA: SusC/RagA family TonB-linked outer membrane protein [Bacteroidales bacterium]|nr:SusC/RagA family TonB-linked outer membrane protein [Bacteroidales bacterium]
MKNLFLIITIVVLSGFNALAQTKNVTGTVTSLDGNEPMAGVTVSVTGTTIGTLTDINGKFTIQVPPDVQTLVFSYIGMKKQEVNISGSNNVNVVLEPDITGLDEVVVTALGISREKKSLGYATQEVQGELISSVKTANFMNSLSGKLSGVQVQRNQNMGGSTNVIVRGSKSLVNSNQVLYVVDGVPINNNIGKYTDVGVTSNQATSSPGYDYGNAAADIDPETIESINVLKGSAATALYGSRASAGVIMITTKKGRMLGQGETAPIGVSLSSSYTFSKLDKSTFPTYQDQYGAGYGTNYTPYFNYRTASGSLTTSDPVNDPLVRWVQTTEDASFGPKFDGQPVWGWYSVDPESPWYKQSKPWEFTKNGPITFFETPYIFTNTVAIDKATEFSSLRLSYTNYNATGLQPNSSLKKNNVMLAGQWNVTRKLTVTASANYIKQNGKGRNATGYNGNIASNFRQWQQTNLDFKDLKTAYELTKRNLTWNYNAMLNYPEYSNNPYWDAYENFETDMRNRFIGNASVDYKITSWLSAFGRVAADTYYELQEERRANGSVAMRFGIAQVPSPVQSGYIRRDNTFSEYNFDIMLRFNKKFGTSFSLNGIAGFNERRTGNTYFYSCTNGGLNVPKVFSLQNSVSALSLPIEVNQMIGVRSQYMSVSLGYRDFLFLDGTFRQDYASTLPESNNKYRYPSVTGAFLFSNVLKADWLSLGKIRLNYAQVGNLAGFDQLVDIYQTNSPMVGANNQLPATKRNPELKNERTNSIEAGLEMALFNARAGFDIAVYKTNSLDQIIPLTVSQSTGFQNLMINAGEIENKGIEVTLNLNPVSAGDFRWDVMLNWSKNQNKVVSLYPGVTNLRLNSGNLQSNVTMNAEVGQPYGVIKAKDYTYDANGKKIIDAETGAPIITTSSAMPIGNFTPDWNAGLTNSLTYKNISMNFLIDMQKGGDIFSLDMYYGMNSGLYPETVFINDLGNPVRDPIVWVDENDPSKGYASNSGGYIIEGVNVDDEGVSTPNKTRVDAAQSDAFGAGIYPHKEFVYDAGYIKLREVVLSYNIPSRFLGRTFIKGASISAIGSNLWIIHKSLPYADPESGMSAGNIQGYTTGSLPTTRDFSFNLKFNF